MSIKTAIRTGAAVAAGLVGGEAAAANLPSAAPAAVSARFDPTAADFSGASFGKRDPLVLLGLQTPQDPPPAVGGAVKPQGPASQPASKPAQDPAPAPANVPDPTLTEVAKATSVLLVRLRSATQDVRRTITNDRLDDNAQLAQLRKFFDGGVSVMNQTTNKVESVSVGMLAEGAGLQTKMLRDFARVLAIVQSNPEMMAEIAKWDPKKDLDPQLKLLIDMRCTHPLLRGAYGPKASADTKAQALVAGTLHFLTGAAIPAAEKIEGGLTASMQAGKSLPLSIDPSNRNDVGSGRRLMSEAWRSIDYVAGLTGSNGPIMTSTAQLCESLVAVYQKYTPKAVPAKTAGTK